MFLLGFTSFFSDSLLCSKFFMMVLFYFYFILCFAVQFAFCEILFLSFQVLHKFYIFPSLR